MKRIISAMAAVLLLLQPTSFAAQDDTVIQTDTASAQPDESTGLPVSATDAIVGTALQLEPVLPESYNDTTLAAALADTVAILQKRVDYITDGTAPTVGIEDEHRIVVTLPSGTDAEAVAAKLIQPAVFTMQYGNSEQQLDNSDLASAESAEYSTEANVLKLSLTPEGLKKAVEMAEDFTEGSCDLDGKSWKIISVPSAVDDEYPEITTGPLTRAEADELAMLLNAGPLPLELKVASIAPVQAESSIDTAAESTTEQSAAPSVEEQPAANSTASSVTYADLEGHWAREVMERAAELNIIQGNNGSLRPDSPMKYNEALITLNRALGDSGTSSLSQMPFVSLTEWYTKDIARALHSGLIDYWVNRNYDSAMTRAEAFELLARAFVYTDADGDISALQKFTDVDSMTDSQKQAAAALIAAGVLNGNTQGQLNPSGAITRAEFITLLMRIAPVYCVSAESLPFTGDRAVVSAPTSELSGMSGVKLVAYSAPMQQASLANMGTVGRVSMKSMNAGVLSVTGSTILSELAVDPAGTAQVTVDDTSSVGTLYVAGVGGAVTYTGTADTIEITSTGRQIILSGMNARRILVSGSNNSIVLNAAAQEISITADAKDTAMTVNGEVGTITVAGIGTAINGNGHAATMDKRAGNCKLTLPADNLLDNTDTGLSNVTMILGHPTKVTPDNSTLLIVARFENADRDRVCSAQWYQDGKPVSGSYDPALVVNNTNTSRISLDFTFTKEMQQNTTVGLLMYYQNPDTGETEKLMEQVTVPIENHPIEWYLQREAGPVLEKVSSTYQGNYTTAYAQNHDYTTAEKETFVNAKGYSSSSQYLLWVNRAYQRVNAFTGSKNNWQLVKSFIVGTGGPGTPTPVGITTVSYKSASGWTTGTYTVRPVVGFYPGTGYAFHSRLCYPGTDNEYDYSGGYPVSHGCVRMNKADVRWIYDTVPVGTTVVIF